MGDRATPEEVIASDQNSNPNVRSFVRNARIAAHPARRLDELLPWNWTPGSAIAAQRRDLRADDAA